MYQTAFTEGEITATNVTLMINVFTSLKGCPPAMKWRQKMVKFREPHTRTIQYLPT